MNGKEPRPVGPMTHAALTVTHHAGGLLMATFGHACIAVWDVKPTRALFDIQQSRLAAVVAREPGRALFMCVVAKGADPPDQEIRDASSKMLASHGKNLAACACVIEGTGFRSAITRTVLTGIMLVVRNPLPSLFCESVDAACKWFEKLSRQGLPGMADEIERARAEHRR